MADGIHSIPLPENPSTSKLLQQRFNDVAKELKVGLEWKDSATDPLQVNVEELTVDQSQWGKYAVTQKTPTAYTPALRETVLKVLQTVEAQRLSRLSAAVENYEFFTVKVPVHLLTKVEQHAVELFAEKVKPLINKIEARQQRPDVAALQDYISLYGDPIAQQMMAHTPYNSCLGGANAFDPICSPVAYFPDKPLFNGMISSDITEEEFKNLNKTLPKDAEELRPTTVLEKHDGKIVAIPLPKHPAFVEDHLQLATELEAIAKLQEGKQHLDPALVKQLKAWATFFRTGTAKDEAIAAQATIDAGESKSLLRVHIGPSESYWKDNCKFPYLMQVGVKDPKIAATLSKNAKRFLAIEASLSTIPNYQPRKISTRGGFADAIYQAVIGGFMESFAVTAPAGNNFPNYAGYHAQGSNRFILLEALLSGRAGSVASKLSNEDTTKWDLQTSVLEQVTDHESGHLLGPQRDHITPSGEKMGVVFGDDWGSADEPKADLIPIVIARLLQQEPQTPEVAADIWRRVRAHFAFTLGKYPGKAAFATGQLHDHGFGKMLQAGYFLKEGAMTLVDTKDGKRLAIHDELWVKAGDALCRKIMAFEAAGDLKGFLAFAKEMVDAIPDEADKLIIEANKGNKWRFIKRELE